MVGDEVLVVRAVAGARHVEASYDEAGAVALTADPAGCLNVLAGRLGLAGDDHEA